jgi:hypothetical protein
VTGWILDRSVKIALIIVLAVLPCGLVFADPQLEIGPDLYVGNQPRGSSFTFNVVARNVGTDDAKSPSVTVFTSDSVNLRIIGSASRDWPGRLIPADGKSYDLGEFAFQISSNAPLGAYVIRIEVSYTTGFLSSTRLVASRTLQLSVEPTPAESSATQSQSNASAILLVIAIILVVMVVAALLLRTRRQHVAATVSPSVDAVFCRYCGARNDLGSSFCPRCGRAIQ